MVQFHVISVLDEIGDKTSIPALLNTAKNDNSADDYYTISDVAKEAIKNINARASS